ncbi:hypothetical protein ACM66B_004560 [Microbotryomycetes sp. NB124-2]
MLQAARRERTSGRRSAAWWTLLGWLWLYTLWPSLVSAAQAVVSVSAALQPEEHESTAHGSAPPAAAAAPAPYRAQIHRPKKPNDSRQPPDAVKHLRFNAPSSSVVADPDQEHEQPQISDLTLSQLVIAVTLDGHVHALKRDSGQWLWTLHDDGGAALSGVSQRERLERIKAGDALGGNLVKGVSRRAAAAARHRAASEAARARASRNGTEDFGMIVSDSANRDDDDRDVLDDEIYIVEPYGGGDIYLYTRDDETGESDLQKLPLSMQELVGQSPFSFPSLSSRIFVGKKDAKFVGVDMRNGRLVGVFGADAGWCEWDEQREASIKSEADYEDDISRRPEDLLYIAKTDYHLTVFAKNSAAPLQTLTYTTYSSSSLGADLQSKWTRTPDNRYFQPMHDGALLCFTAGIPGVSWSIDFETPVVSIFDVAINPEDGKGEQAQPLLFGHPHPLLVEEELPFDFRQLQQLPETTYIGRIGKDVFALNRDNFPLVAFAPSFGEPTIGDRSDAEHGEVDDVIRNDGNNDDGALVPIAGGKCRGIDCLLGRHQTKQTIPDQAIEPAPSRPAIDGPTSQVPLLEPTAVPNPSSPPFPNRSSVLARLSRPVRKISDGDVNPTLFLLFLAMIGYYYVKKLSIKTDRPSKTSQVVGSKAAQSIVANEPAVARPRQFQAVLKEPETASDPPAAPQELEPAQVSAESSTRTRSGSLVSSSGPSPVIPPTKDLPPLPQANGEEVEADSDGEGDTAEKGPEGVYRKKGRRRRGKKGKHKQAVVAAAAVAAAAAAAAGEPVLDPSSSPAPNGTEESGESDDKVKPVSSPLDDDLRGLQLTAADLKEEKELDDFETVSLAGPLVVGGLSVSDKILGYGSHGTVVLRGEFQGRAVAVKRLLKDFVTIATHEVNLLQESDDHPHVIRYFCKEQRETFLYIALELCPASLFDLIDQPSSFKELLQDFDPKRALKQIASGIRHLHNLKIVHRDIKPQNILVSTSTRGKGVRMLISDFGLCKKLDVDESSFQQTLNHAAGSFGYRAPEVFRGQVDPNDAINSNGSTSQLSVTNSSTGSGNALVDPSLRLTRSIDIFSLGCIFYYVLTGGEHPFGGRYEREMNILQGKFSLESLDGLGEEAVEVQHLISRMVANDPRERPTAESVLLHPFFWNAQKRLLFICDASDRFEIMERDPPTPTLVTLEARSQEIVGDDWQKALDRTLLDNLGKYRKYDGKSVRDLLRVLRNKKHHYQDLPEPVRRNLGDLPGGFLSYFTTRFPDLLLHVYATVETHLRDEPMFASTFKIPDDEHI